MPPKKLKKTVMNNNITTQILGWFFLIASFFDNYDTNIICASIFFSASFIIETIEKNDNKLINKN